MRGSSSLARDRHFVFRRRGALHKAVFRHVEIAHSRTGPLKRNVIVLASSLGFEDEDSHPSEKLHGHRYAVDFSRKRFLKFISDGDLDVIKMGFVLGFEDDAARNADVDSLWHRGRWRAMYEPDMDDSDSDDSEDDEDLTDSDPIILVDSGVGGQPPAVYAEGSVEFDPTFEGSEDSDPLADPDLPQIWMDANHRSTWSLERFQALAAEVRALYLEKISLGSALRPGPDDRDDELSDRLASSASASSSAPGPSDSDALRSAFVQGLVAVVERIERDPYHMSTKEQVKVLANLARLPDKGDGLFDRCEAALRSPLLQAFQDDEVEAEQVAALLEAFSMAGTAPDPELLDLCVLCTAMESDQYGREELPTVLFALADLELRDAFRKAEAHLRPQLAFMLERDLMGTHDLLNTVFAYSRARTQPRPRILSQLADNLLRRVDGLDKADLCNCQLALIDFRRPSGAAASLRRLEDALEARWKRLDLEEGVEGENRGAAERAIAVSIDEEAAKRLWRAEFGGRSLADVLAEYEAAGPEEPEEVVEGEGEGLESEGEGDSGHTQQPPAPEDEPLVINIDIDLFGLAPFYQDVQEVMAIKAKERDAAQARAEAAERGESITAPEPEQKPVTDEADSASPASILGNLGARGLFLSPSVDVQVFEGDEAAALTSEPEAISGFLFEFSDLGEDASLPRDAADSGAPLSPLAPSPAALPSAPLHVAHLVEAVNEVLFVRHGYRRAEGPLLPHHHMIHRVLEDGEGSPVVLGTIYMEVCRRAGLPMSACVLEDYLVVFPTHEPLGPPDCPMVVDVYSGGELMRMDEVAAVYGLDPATALAPSSSREVLSALLKAVTDTYWKLATGCIDDRSEGQGAEPKDALVSPAAADSGPLPLPISLETVAEVGRPRIVRQFDLERAIAAAERRLALHKGTVLEAEMTLTLGLLYFFGAKFEESWQELAIYREMRGKEEPYLDVLLERLRLIVSVDLASTPSI